MNQAINTEKTLEHFVNGCNIMPPFPNNTAHAVFGMGCFWGAEKKFWTLGGVYITAVGYAGGHSESPDYQQVCDGNTGHAEVVSVVYMPEQLSYETLLSVFWEAHNPTQGMRQGNDVGSQYRSLIQTSSSEQMHLATRSRDLYQEALGSKATVITTEITTMTEFYYAEVFHQQYLAKNPAGYCGLGGTGVAYPAAT